MVQAMTIEYALTRKKVARSFLQAVANSPQYRRKVLFLAATLAILQVLLRGPSLRSLSAAEILSGAIVFVSVLVLLPVLLFLRAKTDKRILTISPEGISTTIGKKAAQIPWKTVKLVSDGATFILIARNNGNAFFIPNRAFATPADRAQFLEELRLYRTR